MDERLLGATISLDGSILEGGGQLIRTALSLSYILMTRVKISKIRQNRPKPGLAAQHLAGARLVSMISNGTLKDDEIGSTELEHIPGVFKPKSLYLADCGTAGAITLLLQVSLPCLVVPIYNAISDPIEGPTAIDKSGSTAVEYRGGTDVIFSPPIDHTIHVFLPLLRQMVGMRNSLRISVLRRGFYPRGGGIVNLSICDENLLNIAEESPHKMSAINLNHRGRITSVRAVIFGNNSNDQKMRIKDLLLTALQEDFLTIVQTEERGEYISEEALSSGGGEKVGDEDRRTETMNESVRDSADTANDKNKLSGTNACTDATKTIDGHISIPVFVTFDYEEDECEMHNELISDGTCSSSARVDDLEKATAAPHTDTNTNTNPLRKRQKGWDASSSVHQASKKRWKYKVETTGATVWFETDTGCRLSSNFTLQYRKDTSDLNSVDCPISALELSSSSTRVHSKVDAMHDTDLLYYETEGVRIAVDELLFLHRSNACVDEHTADQLLVYMAMARGESQILCAPRCENSSLHIETVMQVVSDFGCAQFSMVIEDGDQGVAQPGCRRIICSGLQGTGKGMSNGLS